MKTTHLRAVLLVLLTLLIAASPTLAQEPQARDGRAEPLEATDITTATEDSVTETGPALSWVSSGATPGFYAARDNRNLDPSEYNLVGGHQSFYWDQLEPFEGQYEWQHIDNFIGGQVAKGKKAAFGIITFNSRREWGSPTNPPIRVPQFVFNAGAGKVVAPDGFEIPRYWDPVYLAKYRNFVAALAAKYDGHPDVEFIQIGVGKYGETQPCDSENPNDNPHVAAAMAQDGYSPADWGSIVNLITDIYADYFSQTTLLLPNAPRFEGECDRRTFTDFAISRGVGLFPAGLEDILDWVDLRTKPGWSGCGKYDRILDHVETASTEPWVPVAFEMYNYMTPDPTAFYWGVLAGLSRHIDYITAERDVLYRGNPGDAVVTPITENIEVMGWASPYMGKTIAEAPSVWVALRESGYTDTFQPQRGNYGWWLEQDDSIAQGRTVVASYRSKREMVYPPYYDYYVPIHGEDYIVRSTIETNQGFLAGSREGWICRRTDQNSGNRYMWFKIHDGYINGGPIEATFTVTYFDRGTDTWQLHYQAVGNAYKVAGTVNKTGTNTWKKATFTVNDALLANGQTGGADFRLDAMGDGDEYIHMVDVTKGGGVGQMQQINLVKNATNDGWNLVSLRLQPTSTAIADVLASIAGKYEIVQAYQNGMWRAYRPGFGGDLMTLDHQGGFWVRVTENCTLSVAGEPPASTQMNLSAANGGWNLISWPSDDTRSVGDALASIAGNYDMIYGYHAHDEADPWKIYHPAVPGYANDLSQFSSGYAYWIHVTSNCSLTVNY